MRNAALLLILALCAAACAGFVYNRLDTVVSWYANRWVSLDDEQERALRDLVNRTLDWHRRTQLPSYMQALEAMAVESAAPLSAERFGERYRQTSDFADALARRVAPDLAALLRTLSPEQIAELAESVAEDNEELLEDYAGPTAEVRHERRVKQALRAIQRLTGRLSKEQRALVDRRLAEMQDLTDEWLDRRLHWQERFFELLRTPPPGERFSAELLELLISPDKFDKPEYRREVEKNRAVIYAMLAELSTGLTPRQRTHLAAKLREYADDLRDIAVQG